MVADNNMAACDVVARSGTRRRQVERLSGLIQTPMKTLCEDGATAEAVRQDIINSSVNIDKRLTKLYDLIENDILGSLQYGCNYIAPYKVRTVSVPPWCTEHLCQRYSYATLMPAVMLHHSTCRISKEACN